MRIRLLPALLLPAVADTTPGAARRAILADRRLRPVETPSRVTTPAPAGAAA